MKQKRVLVVGFGEMGHAMQHLLQSRHAVSIWQRQPATGKAVSLVGATADKDAIIFCIPTGPLNRIVAELKPALQKDTLVISIAKGLDDKGHTAFDAISDALDPSSPRAILYGPMISEEILAGRPGFAEVGSPDPAWSQRVQSLFAGSGLYLDATSDTTGISWCAILKNVYAMAFGMTDALALGGNVRGFLATVALRELAAISLEKGGTGGAPYGLAGLGDLLTTATSTDSHHHALGMRMARGERGNLAGEGTRTIRLVNELNLVDTRQYPLMQLIEEIVLEGGDVEQKWQRYLEQYFSTKQS